MAFHGHASRETTNYAAEVRLRAQRRLPGGFDPQVLHHEKTLTPTTNQPFTSLYC